MHGHPDAGYRRSSTPAYVHWAHPAPVRPPPPPAMAPYGLPAPGYPGPSYAVPTPLPSMTSVGLVHQRPHRSMQPERRYALLEERHAALPRSRSQPSFRPASPFGELPSHHPLPSAASMGSFTAHIPSPYSSPYTAELNIIKPPVISDPEVLSQGGAHKSSESSASQQEILLGVRSDPSSVPARHSAVYLGRKNSLTSLRPDLPRIPATAGPGYRAAPPAATLPPAMSISPPVSVAAWAPAGSVPAHALPPYRSWA
eukprot:EG_transcript_20215